VVVVWECTVLCESENTYIENLFLLSVSYAALCSEHIKDLLQDECVDCESSRDPVTAVQNMRKQKIQSPVNVSC
jgi:hypothetical protein